MRRWLIFYAVVGLWTYIYEREREESAAPEREREEKKWVKGEIHTNKALGHREEREEAPGEDFKHFLLSRHKTNIHPHGVLPRGGEREQW
eukprot:scaffold295047_cov23-Tisochrysis_lutea.AAC.1